MHSNVLTRTISPEVIVDNAVDRLTLVIVSIGRETTSTTEIVVRYKAYVWWRYYSGMPTRHNTVNRPSQ